MKKIVIYSALSGVLLAAAVAWGLTVHPAYFLLLMPAYVLYSKAEQVK